MCQTIHERVFESLDDAFLILDRRLQVVEINSYLLRHLGKTRQEAAGADWASLFPHLAEMGHADTLRSVLEEGRTHRGRIPLISVADWTVSLLDVAIYPIRHPVTGQVTHLVEYGREVTEEVKLQLEVAEANRELLAAKEELEAKAAEIRQANRQMEEKCTILQSINLHLERIAVLDVMTDLPNHRAFQEQLTYQISQAQRHKRPFSLVLFDVDDFKHYNDRFGHPQGDILLAQIARLIRECVRTVDHPARYGGEEFAILLPETGKRGAARVAERLRAAIADFPFDHSQITVSMGVAEFPADAQSGSSLVECADGAMYRAKARGKNTLCLWEGPGNRCEHTGAGESWPLTEAVG